MPKLNALVVSGLLLLILTACSGALTASSPLANVEPDGVEPVALSSSNPTSTPSAAVVETPVETEETVDYCLECHTDQQMLIDTADPAITTINENVGEGCGGEVAPIESWKKVLIDENTFPGSIHGLNGCIDCHGGKNDPDKETAHNGVSQNPSSEPERICIECHPDIVASHKNNLHSNLVGYWSVFNARSLPGSHPAIEKAFQNHCSDCHATCGECHVSRPAVVGGGFINGHVFARTPSMTENCTACHGSRVGDEFMGKNEGLNADVHFSEGQMECVNCHSGSEMHGAPADCNTCHKGPEAQQVPPPTHRYDGIQSPRCEACHPAASTGKDKIMMHQMHGAKLACQVCHSISYTSCDGCHVAISKETGNPYYETEATYTTFLIGRNPYRNYERPYEYVPVRHIPVSSDTFAFYGINLLGNFDNLETWKYTTPHNIQRKTPQTASCNTCHGNSELFLTADKVNPDELKANESIIVDSPPVPITSADQLP